MEDPSDYVLYFPSIEFQNDNWVKSSLLYWDKIYRIVPESYTPKDNDLIIEAQEQNLIRDIILDENDIKTTGDQFLKFIEGLDFLPAGLERESYDFVSEDKIDRRLYPFLEKIGNIYDQNGWLKIPRNVARGYMFYLANVVAKRRGGFSVSTDNPDNWVISSFFVENGNFAEYTYDRAAEGYYSSLVLDGFIPSDLSHVSLDSIINFLDDEKEHKNKLRRTVSTFSSSLSKCQNEEMVSELIEDKRLDIESQKNDLKKNMGFLANWKSYLCTSIVMGIPIAASALKYFTENTGDPFDYYSVAVGLSCSAVAAYKDYSTAVENHKNQSVASYLVDVDTKLARNNKQKSYANFGSSFNQFIND